MRQASRALIARVTAGFQARFPRAHVTAAYDTKNETWTVAVVRPGMSDHHPPHVELFTMTIGTDDDEFSFRCLNNPRRGRVRFAL